MFCQFAIHSHYALEPQQISTICTKLKFNGHTLEDFLHVTDLLYYSNKNNYFLLIKRRHITEFKATINLSIRLEVFEGQSQLFI